MVDWIKERQEVLGRVYLVLFLVLAIALQYSAASTKSFWGDEAKTALLLQKDAAAIQDETPADHQPLFITVMSVGGRLFGYEEIGLRTLPILFGLMTLMFTYLLGTDLYGEKAGLIGVTILGLSPLFLLFAHNARYYSMMSALAVLAALSLVRYQSFNRQWYLLLYSFAGAAMLHLVFSSVIFIIGCNVWWLIQYLSSRKRSLSDLAFWILAQALILAIYLPGTARFTTFTDNFFQIPEVSSWLRSFSERLAYAAFVFSMGGSLSPMKPLAWIGVETVVIIAVFAMVAVWRSKLSGMAVFFTAWIAAAAVLATFFSEWHNQIWQNLAHWFFYLLPFLALWLGVGLAQMKLRIMAFMSALLAVVFAAGIINYFNNREFFQPVYAVSWKSIFSHIHQNARPEAMVICTGVETSCWYYANKNGLSVELPWELKDKADPQVSEVWWVHANVGGFQSERQSVDREFLQYAGGRFQNTEVMNYGEHDASIRWLKARFTQHTDYEYQVVLYHFFNP